MKRTIRSYVLRAGRISTRQQQALDHDLEQYTLPCDLGLWDFKKIFGRDAPVIVEIGFGMGGSLFEMASVQPEVNFIGIEVHRAGIGAFVAKLKEAGLTNVRIAPMDAKEVFMHCIKDHSLLGIQIFFPDPWPKKKHHKRRLIQAPFVDLIVGKLQPNGWIHCATDWQPYADQMLSVLSETKTLRNSNPEGGFIDRPETRPLTKFEQRGIGLGHRVFDLLFLA